MSTRAQRLEEKAALSVMGKLLRRCPPCVSGCGSERSVRHCIQQGQQDAIGGRILVETVRRGMPFCPRSYKAACIVALGANSAAESV